MCSSLFAFNISSIIKPFHFQVPAHCVYLIWVPIIKYLSLKETADSLASTTLGGHLFPVLLLTAHITWARFQMSSILKALSDTVLTDSTECKNQVTSW